MLTIFYSFLNKTCINLGHIAQRQADLAADPNAVADDEEIELEPWQKVYTENRKEAIKSHEKFLGQKLDLTENGLSNCSPLPSLNVPHDSG